jgi:hypothetical protein
VRRVSGGRYSFSNVKHEAALKVRVRPTRPRRGQLGNVEHATALKARARAALCVHVRTREWCHHSSLVSLMEIFRCHSSGSLGHTTVLKMEARVCVSGPYGTVEPSHSRQQRVCSVRAAA